MSVDGDKVTASVTVRNVGSRAGAAIPQLYLSGPQGDSIPLRLAGWSRIDLAPGEEREATISVDPRLLATFDEAARRWRIAAGSYRMTAGFDADQRDLAASFSLEFGGAAAVTGLAALGYHAANVRLTRLRKAARRARGGRVHSVDGEIFEAPLRIDQNAPILSRTKRRGGSCFFATAARVSP